MKRNGETVEYQVTLNIPHLRGKNQQNLRESPCFLREWRKPVRFWLCQRASLSLRSGSRETGLPSQSRSARQGRVAAPSVCFAAARILLAAAARILLAAAPTAPPCFRHWRRSSPLPPKGEPLAKPFTLRGLPKPPLGRGGGTASAVTERLSPAAAHGQALS